MLNVRSHSSLLLVIMLPPPLIPALLNNKWILSVWWRLATSSRNRSTCARLSDISGVRRNPQPLRQSRRLAQPLRFRQACRRDVAHFNIAGFRHQLADQLAAHSAAAAGDYRGPPRELGHVRPPLRGNQSVQPSIGGPYPVLASI